MKDLETIFGTFAFDANGDGLVNVLYLIVVANAFGKDEPDVNGDGLVNVLDFRCKRFLIVKGEIN